MTTHKRDASNIEELEQRRLSQKPRFVVDLWDDEEHQQLDHEITSNSKFARLKTQEDFTPQQALLFPLVLQAVISQVNRRAETTGRDPSEMLLEDKTLLHQLQGALKKGSLKEVRNLDILRLRPRAHGPISKAWFTPTQNGVEFLTLMTVRDQWEATAEPYAVADCANCVSVCQSSGTGKSRMVHEMGQYIFTIPFNLRAPDHEGGAYPLPDDAVRDYLTQTAPSVKVYQKRCQVFFATLFRAILGFLNQCPGPLSELELAHVWRLFLEENKRSFYLDVVSYSSQQSVDGNALAGLQELMAVFGSERPVLPKSSIVLPTVKSLGQERLIAYVVQGKERAEKARKTLEDRRIPVHHNLKVVIYFDEAHTLYESTVGVRKIGLEMLMYDHILALLNSFNHEPLFSVFLSTSLRLQTASPTVSSARQTDNFAFPPPITEISFDCHPALVARLSLTESLCNCQSITFMARFGRPLFWTLLEAGASERTVLELACNKIAGYSYGTTIGLPTPQTQMPRIEAAIACLDLRLCFHYEPCRGDPMVDSMEAKLVENHMRLCYSVPESRAYFWSGYSSEPLLAEAAAQVMQYWAIQHKWRPVRDLSTWLGSKLIQRGERGEIGGRLLLMSAYDNAIREHARVENTSKFLFSSGCTVDAFVNELFQPQHVAKIRKCKPDNVISDDHFKEFKSFSEALGGGWIRFTHFVKGSPTCELSQQDLYAAFVRGMAYIGQPNEQSFDVIIPVSLAKSDAFSFQDMTAIFIQFKSRKVKGGVRHDYTTGNLDVFPGGNSTLPYCSLLMEFGIAPPQAPDRKKGRAIPTEIAQGGKTSPRLAPSTQMCHLRYSIRASGSTSNIYKPIGGHDQDRYSNIFQVKTPLDDHGRQGVEYVNRVLAMKPGWVHDSFQSWPWLQDPDTTAPVLDNGLDGEDVEVGRAGAYL
ncbi:hypothetical protein EST38_g6823 [Candolleomyces aberdarensis]|uniref:Uncharacterized protein n=1 Tax=Candolleomyces aberdarensis TaxID=2316362 RepID=A0A4Q2DGP8_9AGAR|nr:hypothetical protein EST38_g6823 [Candolleomyces aberdarensis]